MTCLDHYSILFVFQGYDHLLSLIYNAYNLMQLLHHKVFFITYNDGFFLPFALLPPQVVHNITL